MSQGSKLDAYYQRVSNMDARQLSEHLRENYRDPSQDWPDYLDFLDDWEYNYERRLLETQRDFILLLATRETTISCGDHFHHFTTSTRSNSISFQHRDDFIDYSSCWFKTIAETDSQLVRSDPQARAVRLSVPESQALKQLALVKIVTLDNMPPMKLDFEQFREDWLSKSSRSQAVQILLKSSPRPLVLPLDLSDMKVELQPPEPIWLSESNPIGVTPETIFDNDALRCDHGLHLLLLSRPDRVQIIDMINKTRAYDPSAIPVSYADIALAMDTQCDKCQALDSVVLVPSPPAIYYAPPGNGKSTTMRNKLFIGIDTDWLLKNSDFDTVVAPFLKLGIPILTNQYHLVKNTSFKQFGSFNYHKLRSDDKGQPFTPLSEIKTASDILGDDSNIIFSKKYFSEMILTLYRMNFLYEFSRQKFSSLARVDIFPMTHKPTPVSVSHVVDQLVHVIHQAHGVKHRRRKKVRAKLGVT